VVAFGGLRVLVLESRRAREMATLVSTFGGEPVSAPSMREVPLESNTEALAFADGLDKGAFDRAQLIPKACLNTFEQPPKIFTFFAADLAACGAPDVEAVAAGDDQVVHAHKLLDRGAVAPADHAHGAAGGQPAYGPTHPFRDHRVLWAVDDRRQRAIIVEEHSRRSALHVAG